MLKLFERQWFGRVWVLQECAVAEEAVVLIGEHKRAWEDIGSSVVYFSHKSCSAAVQGFSSRLRNVLGSWGSGGVGRSGRVEKAVSGAHLVAGMCTVV